ncbi:dipeptidase [Undibacterium sp. Di24W]|uniref:dipeptidase n=1 Tax=Undibacterium sp. Di24W TaxID=3413033 RepID=UPI003BF2B2FA
MKKLKQLILVPAMVCWFACSTLANAQTMPKDADPQLWSRALKIHRSAIIVDGHNDIPTPLVDEDFNLARNTIGQFHLDGDPFHTDLARLKASGVTGEFFSIYVSGDTLKTGGAMHRAMDMIDARNREVEKHAKLLSACNSSADIRQAKQQHKVCALMGIEGGYAIENSLHALRNFYRLGIRYMTLTHNVSHDWADAHADVPKNNGLSSFGKDVVKEMNRLGMLVDISHVSEKVMQDVLDISSAPIIASHSGARGVNDHTRNVPDAVLKRLAKNGGVVMINFFPAFLDARTNQEMQQRKEKLKPELNALQAKLKDSPNAYPQAERQILAQHPIYIASYTRIVDHIDYIKKIAGIDHVGLGSDYDGIPMLPAGMQGMEDLALVTFEMLRRGYTEAEIKKVLGENFLGAFAQAEKVANVRHRSISGDGSLSKLPK